MKNKKYNLLFKTGDAELRALEKNTFDISSIFPIIELTRGRKSKKDSVGLISGRINRISQIFQNQTICIDLTTDDDLSNIQIKNLYDYSNGYSNWIEFIKELHNQKLFKEIIPTILVDTTDENIDFNLLEQVKGLTSTFNHILYRNNINDNGCYDDIEIIKSHINNSKDVQFTFVLDCEYIPVGAHRNVIDVLNARIEKIKQLIDKTRFIIIASSFPRYVSDIGNDYTDIFSLVEIDVHNGLDSQYDVQYGDYGSINPTRNDTVSMARGWIPRIDVPTLDGIFYYRFRKKDYGNDYARTYSAVAREVIADSRFPKDYSQNWGVNQIQICSDGDSPGSSPSFWISVRMSIFIEMQIRRLKK